MVRIFEDQIPGLTCAIILFKCNLICMNYNSHIIQHYIVIVITQTCEALCLEMSIRLPVLNMVYNLVCLEILMLFMQRALFFQKSDCSIDKTAYNTTARNLESLHQLEAIFPVREQRTLKRPLLYFLVLLWSHKGSETPGVLYTALLYDQSWVDICYTCIQGT